jgi:hypothetical protein
VTSSAYQRLRGHLSYLGLQTAAEHLASHLDDNKSSVTEVLESLLSKEVDATRRRRTAGVCVLPTTHFERRWRSSTSRSSRVSIARSSRSYRRCASSRSIATCCCWARGVGKTHLAIALGIAATEAGYRTYFTSAQDLVRHLSQAHRDERFSSKMRTYTGPSVLVIDELGYLPMDAESAHWIFEVVTRRYERGSIVLTSEPWLR